MKTRTTEEREIKANKVYIISAFLPASRYLASY